MLIRFGAHRDSIYNSEVTKAPALTPQAPGATRKANADALIYRHPTPPIVEVVFPTFQAALDNLPEEPTPLALPALKGCFFQPEDMEDDSDHQQREGAATSEAPGTLPQNPLAGVNPTEDHAAAQGPPETSAATQAGSGPGPVTQQTKEA